MIICEVRDLYKNTFKIFSDVNEEEMISESDSTENKKNLLFDEFHQIIENDIQNYF